ncbi:hypothetical protein TNCV_4079741 [Trichonephila clavipes]|nr:hypothetical protein TNCV_4079741 [Trichonephila clavipes]
MNQVENHAGSQLPTSTFSREDRNVVRLVLKDHQPHQGVRKWAGCCSTSTGTEKCDDILIRVDYLHGFPLRFKSFEPNDKNRYRNGTMASFQTSSAFSIMMSGGIKENTRDLLASGIIIRLLYLMHCRKPLDRQYEHLLFAPWIT